MRHALILLLVLGIAGSAFAADRPYVKPKPYIKKPPCCTLAAIKMVQDMNKFDNELYEHARGIVTKEYGGQPCKTVQNTVFITWWMGPDGWAYGDSNADAQELLEGVKNAAKPFFPDAKCSIVTANPGGVFLAPHKVVKCILTKPCN